jgi:hypothetical protein
MPATRNIENDAVVVRPNVGNGWIVEVSYLGGISAGFASNEEGALRLARLLGGSGNIRILPAADDGGGNFTQKERVKK